jgi:hypothetical protein
MLTTLMLWGLLGLLGQGVRAIIGLQARGYADAPHALSTT